MAQPIATKRLTMSTLTKRGAEYVFSVIAQLYEFSESLDEKLTRLAFINLHIFYKHLRICCVKRDYEIPGFYRNLKLNIWKYYFGSCSEASQGG